MFDTSRTELATLDATLEPLLNRAREQTAQAEQLALDATRLLSVRPEQLGVVSPQPFYRRLWVAFSGQPTGPTPDEQRLYAMQKLGWRYLQMLNERDLMLAHGMITVKNNLLTLAVAETETRQMLTDMANRIADRFERLEDRVGQLEVQQGIHGWLLTLDTLDYPDRYPERLRLLRVLQDFQRLKPGDWSVQEIRYLQKALKDVELPWRASLSLADFIDGLIDDIEAAGFDSYATLIRFGDPADDFDPRRALECIATPSHRALYKIADSYGHSRDTLDILADQLALSRQDALKRLLRGFIEKDGIDTGVTVPLRDLAVELLGCQSLARRLLGAVETASGSSAPAESGRSARPAATAAPSPTPTAPPPEEAPAPSAKPAAVPVPELVRLPGGAFWMGSPSGSGGFLRGLARLIEDSPVCDEPPREEGRRDDERRHVVTVRPFAIGKYPVTQAEWQAVMGNNPSRFTGCDRCPVESVSWHDAQAYIEKLNALTGQRFRLPTEAEWEYAARAGQNTRYAGSDDIDAVAWYSENSGGQTHPVGQKQPNAFGLYDLSGNVWEWTASAYVAEYDGSELFSTNDANARRVFRGGSWVYTPDLVRSAYRGWSDPTSRNYSLGFRLAQD